MQATMLV
jgi:hypothetical protein